MLRFKHALCAGLVAACGVASVAWAQSASSHSESSSSSTSFSISIGVPPPAYWPGDYGRPPAPYYWVRSGSGAPIPGGAFVGGHENGQPLFVCRAPYLGGVYPGKLIGGNCNISYNSSEISTHSFDVLVGEGARWAPAGPRFRGAFIAGFENGGPLYLCQAPYGGDVHPGKIYNGRCDISYGGREIPIDRFNVLYADESMMANDFDYPAWRAAAPPPPAWSGPTPYDRSQDDAAWRARQRQRDLDARQRDLEARQQALEQQRRDQAAADRKVRAAQAEARAAEEARRQAEIRRGEADENRQAAEAQAKAAADEAKRQEDLRRGEEEENRQAADAQAKAQAEAQKQEEIKRGEEEENRQAAEAQAKAQAEADAQKQEEIKRGEEEENRQAAEAAAKAQSESPPPSTDPPPQ